LCSQSTGLTSIKTICIDAGHGGKDPGCHGASANEKAVCLSMALKLGAKIKAAYPSLNVIYTRDKDVFVELDERAKIANRNKADLFICIHANAGAPNAYGTETYVLGLHKTDAQQQIADRENSTVYLENDKGVKYKDFDLSPDAIIGRQLQLSVFLDHSINFASKLQTEFKRIGRYDRGVKQAGFVVLFKTTMPSVLIETGFLTNKNDESFLKEDVNQDKMSQAMFDAFQKYKKDLEGIENSKGGAKQQDKESVTNELNKEKNSENTKIEQKTNAKIEEKKVDLPIIFSVQLESSDKKLDLDIRRFRGKDVYEIAEGKVFKYFTGRIEGDFDEANRLKNLMRNNGFDNAFVVAFENGIKISLEKAKKMAKKM
ncbi:MAG: N-acetylmuramoyl-L-alanine amidase, partial [Crocinitomicaceae bacterium]|nr:N-acetylmuramoyl-L-alanine amidase [Crocinitomicaceae bacterium]